MAIKKNFLAKVCLFVILNIFVFMPMAFGFEANETSDLRQTNTPLIQDTVIEDVATDSLSNGAYIVGDGGVFGHYNFISNTTDDLRETDVGDWFTTNNAQFLDIAYDSKNDGAYISGYDSVATGKFGYYNKTSNTTIELNDFGILIRDVAYDSKNDGVYIASHTDGSTNFGYYSKSLNSIIDLTPTGNRLNTVNMISVAYDSKNDGAYFVAQSGGGGLRTFGYYNKSTNATTYLGNTDSGDFIGDSNSHSLKDVAYDNINDGVYIVGENGLLAYYSRATNATIDLSKTDDGDWIGATSIEGVTYDSINDGAYIVGLSGLAGYYSKSLNTTIDLRSTDSGDWLGSENPDISGIAFDNKSKGMYFGGSEHINGFGLFGVYSLINIDPVPTGLNVFVDAGDSVSLTFASVTSDGETVVNTTKSSSGAEFLVDGTYYDITTTSSFDGTITITLPYDPLTVSEPLLVRIYHFDKALDTWVDVTTSVDTKANTVTGVVTALSPFAVGSPSNNFVGFLPPINNDDSSKFRLGSTIPVKFQLVDTNGAFVTNATAHIFLTKIENGIIGDQIEAVSTNAPDSGNTFRYDSTSNQYIFNLGTKSLSVGTWSIRVELDDGTSHTVLVSLSGK